MDNEARVARGDLYLAGLSAGLLALLLAVSWRASPDRHDVTLVLYVVAGALEFIGALTIAIDLLARRRRVRGYEAALRDVVIFGKSARDHGAAGEAEVVGGRKPTLRERVAALELRSAGEMERTRAALGVEKADLEQSIREAEDAADAASRRRDQQIVDLIGPGDRSWPAWVGFGGLLLGVAVGTAANILSAAG